MHRLIKRCHVLRKQDLYWIPGWASEVIPERPSIPGRFGRSPGKGKIAAILRDDRPPPDQPPDLEVEPGKKALGDGGQPWNQCVLAPSGASVPPRVKIVLSTATQAALLRSVVVSASFLAAVRR